MTNEELKKKIINLLDEATGSWYEDEDGMFAEGYSAEEGDNRFKAHVADALIAAGLKFDVSYSFTAAFNSVQAERERDLEHKLTAAEHRAEVAEKALLTACIKMVKYEKSDVNIELLVGVIYRKYLKQAERELAEEEKDEQN